MVAAMSHQPFDPYPPDEELTGEIYQTDREKNVRRVTPTGFAALDRVTQGGMRSGQLTVVAGATGRGKSAFIEQLTIAVARVEHVLAMPLEMGRYAFRNRIAAKVERCSYGELERHGPTPTTIAELNILRLVTTDFHDCRYASLINVITAIAQTQARVIVIDSPTYIDEWLGTDDLHTIVARMHIVTRLLRLAEDTAKHIVLCAQLNRTAYGPKAGPPLVSQIQDTSAFERLASNVWLLHRPFYEDPSRDTITELIVAKNRHGPACKLHFRWVGETMSLWPLSDEELSLLDCCTSVRKRRQ